MKRSPKRGVAVSRPVFGEVRADAAGIDVHSEENWVAVPPDKPGPTVRKFGACTADLHQLADWLQACGVKTVAMESTGVYWIPLFGILEARGLQVFLVNARHAKNVPGRPKTDCLDCQWLQKLHACGLLNASFRPDDSTCRLRTLLRYRDVLIKSLSCHTQRMQKALSEMNVLLHKVVSDITGSTGMRILEAILAGRRDYQRMAGELVDPQIQASAEQIGRALEGDYRPEQLFVLGQELEARRFVQQQIGACDGKIEEQLAIMQAAVAVPPDPPQPLTGAEKRRGNAPDFDVQSYLYRLTGVDLTRIPGIGASAALALTSETGIDMAPWRTDQAFASWSCLCPDTRISAGRSKGGRPQRSANRVKHIFPVRNREDYAKSLRHLAEVNGFSPDELTRYIQAAFRQYVERSKKQWKVTFGSYAFLVASLRDKAQRVEFVRKTRSPLGHPRSQ